MLRAPQKPHLRPQELQYNWIIDVGIFWEVLNRMNRNNHILNKTKKKLVYRVMEIRISSFWNEFGNMQWRMEKWTKFNFDALKYWKVHKHQLFDLSNIISVRPFKYKSHQSYCNENHKTSIASCHFSLNLYVWVSQPFDVFFSSMPYPSSKTPSKGSEYQSSALTISYINI